MTRSVLSRRAAVVLTAVAALAGAATATAVTAAAAPATAAAAAAPATGTVLAASTPVKDSYIVVLKDGKATPTAVRQAAAALAAGNAGAVTHTYTAAVRGFAVRMTAERAKRLAADPRVAVVAQDGVVSADVTQSPATWGLDRIDQRALPLSNSYTYDTTASNVHAYVIDTGIRAAHTEFGGRASIGTDTVGDGQNGNDCNGHGTHVAGTVGGSTFGVAKAVQIVAVRVLNCAGSGTNAGVIAGVDWVTANAIKPAVANMSLGGGVSAPLDTAVRNSIASGVTYALAAGNSNANACNSSPSRVTEAIVVGASTRTDARATFSNIGTCLDLFAPGQDITSSWNTSNTATNTISGTSMASPHAAGAAALYLATHTTATPPTVQSALVANATPNVIANPGTGSPNRLLFTGAGGTTPPPTGTTFSNATDVPVPDAGAAVTSPITVTGVTGTAPAALPVAVDIRHTYRGDLVVDLVAPDGTAFRLKGSSSTDSADNVIGTFTVNASTEVANGTWQLRVQDVFRLDTGFINSWSLTF
jgi:subtilisin family serine protease